MEWGTEFPWTMAYSETATALSAFARGYLAYRNLDELRVIDTAAERDGGCGVAYALASLFWMMESEQDVESAGPLIVERARQAQALAAADGADPGTRRWAAAIAALAFGGGGARAAQELEAWCAEEPRDALAAKLLGGLHFAHGRSHEMLRVAQRAHAAARPDAPYVDGQLAFALIENWRPEEADRHGRDGSRKAAALGGDPWAHHAVAHVLEVTGRPDDGLRWMEPLQHAWDGCHSFMYTHNYWHMALFHLDLARSDTVLRLYDERVWNCVKQNLNDQTGAISLLWRCEMRDVNVGHARWDELADYLRPGLRAHADPFFDWHRIYCLERAGDSERIEEFYRTLEETASLFLSTSSTVSSLSADDPNRWTEVVLPLCRAISMYARGEYDAASDRLNALVGELPRLGGSNAQRDVVEQMRLDALLRAGRDDEARPLFDRRFEMRGHGTPWLARQWARLHPL
jgi:hypothetical protein